jgi:hypothetical protein
MSFRQMLKQSPYSCVFIDELSGVWGDDIVSANGQ